MRQLRIVLTLGALVAMVMMAQADPPGIASAPAEPAEQPEGKDPPKKPKDEKQPEKKLPPDVFSSALVPRREPTRTYQPNMMGDFPGYFTRRTVTFNGVQTTTTTTVTQGNPAVDPPIPGTTTTTTETVPVNQPRNVLVHTPPRGAFKVSENTSPRPVDRVFFCYNFYGDIRGPEPGHRLPLTRVEPGAPPPPPGGGVATSSVQTVLPGAPSLNVHREVIGFEKTIFDGFGSIEVRLPVTQQTGPREGFNFQNVGDLWVGTKYAVILDQDTGNVLSGGLAITIPTGPSLDTVAGSIHPVLLQPWIGYIWNMDRFFLQAFHSIVIPTDSRDVTLLFNDVSVNWWLIRREDDRPLSFVVATLECHVTTPLNHRGLEEPIVVPDLVVLTAGLHVGLFRNTIFTVGMATPVSGPRVFGHEAFFQFNRRF